MSAVCAVLDVGKSNTKICIVSAAGDIRESEAVATPHAGRGFDADAIFDWFCAKLRGFSARHAISRLMPVAHGATCAYLDTNLSLVRPVDDYEQEIPAALSEEYSALRPPFSETFSPDLPQGLNLGRQIFAFSRGEADQFARVRWILPHPQYWAWRFSGALATERTSLGSHTDLWRPASGGYSSLVERLGWTQLFAPFANAWDDLGPIRPEIAAATGLAPACRVRAGVHDTNAALFPFIARKSQQTPAVLSTGTWVVALAPNAPLSGLDGARDCVANVDVFGRAIACARFMGGREYDHICAGAAAASDDAVKHVLARELFALPSFAAGGPFPGKTGRLMGAENATDAERAALACLYLALMSDVSLDLAGVSGPVVVEGPASKNEAFLRVLAALRDAPVGRSDQPNGVTLGAAALAFWPEAIPDAPLVTPSAALDAPALASYKARWRRLAAG